MALVAITLVAALLYTWNIGYSGLSTYYAADAKSMSESWRAMFFGALNPSATTTLDKLSGFLVPQAISIRLFGFHAWALSLPQAVEGVITIVASFVIGSRWRGVLFGMVLAFLMAFTPMLAAMFGHPMEDGMLTMCTVLAFAAGQRAVLGGRFLWLIVSVGWVAVGFQAKMMQAWLVLPAIGIMWYLGTQAPRLIRVLKLTAAAVVVLALSVSWMTAIQLVPAPHRPYVDGTTNNNMFSMVFGYNGFDRLIPGLIPGAIPQLASSASDTVNTTSTSDAGHSVYKLLETEFASQIGWLLPLALAGIVLVAIAVVTRPRPDPRVRVDGADPTAIGMVFWFLVPAAVLSVAFVPHATYFAQIALPLCALALYAAVVAVRRYRAGDARRWMILPSVIVIETLWELSIIWRAPAVLRFIFWPVAILGGLAVIILVGARLRAHGVGTKGGLLRAAMAASAVAALIGPIAWSACVIGPGGGGSASDAYAGPRSGPLSTVVAARRTVASRKTGLRLPFTSPPVPTLDSQQELLLHYISARNGGRQLLFASDSLPISVSFLLYTNDDAVPMGGFSRVAPDPGTARVTELIDSGALRFVLLNDSYVSAQPDVLAVRRWVTQTCAPVFDGKFREGSRSRQELYDCAGDSRSG